MIDNLFKKQNIVISIIFTIILACTVFLLYDHYKYPDTKDKLTKTPSSIKTIRDISILVLFIFSLATVLIVGYNLIYKQEPGSKAFLTVLWIFYILFVITTGYWVWYDFIYKKSLVKVTDSPNKTLDDIRVGSIIYITLFIILHFVALCFGSKPTVGCYLH
jgi:hypothetical protein